MLRIFPEIEAARRRPAHPDFARPRSLPAPPRTGNGSGCRLRAKPPIAPETETAKATAKGNDGGSPGRNARTLPPGYLPAAE